MSKLSRIFQKAFGSTGVSGDFGKFGSWADGTKVFTKDLTVIQELAAFLNGWGDAVKADKIPTLEEFNSLFLLIFYQLCYLFEQGMPEWDDETTYYTGSFCQVSGVLYKSLVDNNLNNAPASSPASWVAAIPTPASVLEAAYPIGSVYINASVNTNPATLLGFGTWAALGAGRVLVGIDSGDADFDTLGKTAGEKTHALTAAEGPTHSHDLRGSDYSPAGGGATVTLPGSPDGYNAAANKLSALVSSSGSGTAHNNVQPSIVVAMWKRTA